jgi:chorismate dehydratase
LIAVDRLGSPGGAKVRVGAVSYLNAKPLVYELHKLAPQAQIVYDLPSRLAAALEARRLDVAMIPSIEYLRNPSYRIVSDVCIGCRGPVLSVKLLSRRPIPKIRTLALDEGSRTSVALALILLQRKYGLSPRLESLPVGADPEQSRADAVLLIGDRAIHGPTGTFVEKWDLGDEWYRWSELPFVFAMWTARRGADLAGLEPVLVQARDAGVAHLAEIARAEAAPVGMTIDRCLAYLRDNLYFYLGPRERSGLELFRRCAAELNLVAVDHDCTDPREGGGRRADLAG